jgi:CHAT domain-containing protein
MQLTSQFLVVTAFCQSLVSGAEPSSALRSAKLALRRRGVAPFVWAPYKLVTRNVLLHGSGPAGTRDN